MKRSRTYPYDRSDFVPSPKLSVSVCAPDNTGKFAYQRALLDTGATRCCMPNRVLKDLELTPADRLRVEDADGAIRQADAYDVFLTIAEHFSEPIRVLSTNSDEALIGRDVMDRWRLTFDGPKRRLEIESVI